MACGEEQGIARAVPRFNRADRRLQRGEGEVRGDRAQKLTVTHDGGGNRGEHHVHAVVGIDIGFDDHIFMALFRQQIIIAAAGRFDVRQQV